MDHIQDVADRWSERLTGLLKAHGHLHLLLNRFHGLDDRLAAGVAALPDQQPLNDPYFGKAVERAPLLVKVTMADLPWLDQASYAAAEAALDSSLPASPVFAWLQTQASTQLLGLHLRAQIDLHLEGHPRSVFFCFFDPRVMPYLPPLLTSPERAHLFGPVDVWLAPGRDGSLQEWARPDEPKEPTKGRGLRLTHQQAEALERIDTINQTVRLLLEQGEVVPHAANARLDEWVRQAGQLGLAQTDDQASYAALAYAWPRQRPDMQTDERVSLGLELARQGLPLADYLKQNPSITSDQP